MSIVPARLKCDQCGTVAGYKDARDWFSVLTRLDLAITGQRVADLCSWPCLRDYATVQALDPDNA